MMTEEMHDALEVEEDFFYCNIFSTVVPVYLKVLIQLPILVFHALNLIFLQ